MLRCRKNDASFIQRVPIHQGNRKYVAIYMM
jgi:hypothetical protein